MPATAISLPVTGRFKGDHFILAERLVGYDTFLSGMLEINGISRSVRILTFDDITVLKMADSSGLTDGVYESGILHIPHGLRSRQMALELERAASARRRDLTALDDAELRYALTFLSEAVEPEIREARVDAIISALPPVPQLDGRNPIVISFDVGGTLGSSSVPSVSSRLRSASQRPPDETRDIIREQLFTLPEISSVTMAEICYMLGIESALLFDFDSGEDKFIPYRHAIDVVRELSYYGTVITISNVSAIDLDMKQLRLLFEPWVTDFFPSCRTGCVKPDRRAFDFACNAVGASVEAMIHVGDSWQCDVKGALAAGARPIWISRGRPMPERMEDDTVMVATDLRQVVPLIQRMIGSRL
ncbi:HAD family hydrolase [Nocardia farcinica]|uniref:HAD family hydrolase n=1 Tax=Nocardia farcinica TaxID=37329 RepID=UPI001895D1E3|nr:HAD family hydrolase [Nocardia farcinica]MBF6259876.1 HAD family hydrolase [Nocardia farcinica]